MNCSNCPAHRKLRRVKFEGRELNLCPTCFAIAVKLKNKWKEERERAKELDTLRESSMQVKIESAYDSSDRASVKTL